MVDSSQETTTIDPQQDRENSSLFEPSVEFRNLIIDPILDAELNDTLVKQTQKEFFERGINQLKIEGCPEKHISKTLRRIYEERKYDRMKKVIPTIKPEECKLQNPSWFYKTMQKNNVTDPDYSHNTKEPKPQKELINFELENKSWIEQINLIEMFCRKFKDFLNNNTFDGTIEPEEKKETLQIFNALIQDSLESINNKTKIQKYHQYLLYETYCIVNIGDLASKYSEKLKQIQNVTPKQLRKILAGRCTGLLDIFCPKTTYEATKLGFSGIICDNCKSLRTVFDEIKKGNIEVYCYACHTHSKRVETTLPKPNLLYAGYREPHPVEN